MSEFPEARPTSPDSILERVNASFNSIAESDPYRDPYQVAFAKAIAMALHEDRFSSPFKQIFGMKASSTGPVSELTTQFQRSFQHQLWLMDENEYPIGFEDAGRCYEAITDILTTPSKTDRFVYDAGARNLQSCVYDREKMLKLFVGANPDRFPEGVNVYVIEGGSSRGHGAIALSTNEPFKNFTDVYNAEGVISPVLKTAANFILGKTIHFTALGVDIQTDATDSEIKTWCRACSTYPGRILNPDKTGPSEYLIQYDRLDSNPHYPVLQADLAEEGLQLFGGSYKRRVLAENVPNILNRIPPDEKADIFTAFTMFYQLQPHEQIQAFENMKRYVKPNGFVIIQDFAELDPGEPLGLRFYSNWMKVPFRYRTFVYDMLRPELGFQEVFRMLTGRAEAAMIMSGYLTMGLYQKAGTERN